ncbi:MAG TPA: glucosyl-3-phosphoglycerate synthase, partial [Solirubrobacteraceae bacterium]|nr:glucosyl-3-phosphoglycerate synthase [Solirubrobacteraceae bacterium]
MELAAVVVIPARDEEQRIGACLRALAGQTVGAEAFETIVVLDACRDRTADVVDAVREASRLAVTVIDGPGTGAGAARRAGMDVACERLMSAGRPLGLIACTDADSRPAPDWLERQLAHVAAGARAIAGLIELDEDEARDLPPGVRERRERDAVSRLRRVRGSEPDAAHHHFAGASIGVTAATYSEVGGIEPLAALEDAGFAARLARHNVPILRASDVRVRTSARSDGRVARGLSVDLAVSGWFERRRYRAGDFPPQRLQAAKGSVSVSVIIPTKECADTIGGVLRDAVGPVVAEGLVDEVIVIDAGSGDGTVQAAAGAGARVLLQDEIRADLGPALGKGDAMWRALQVTSGDIVCFLDGDTGDPSPSHLRGLLGPLLCDPTVELVKGTFERPLRAGDVSLPHEGGRVTELMARPLLNLYEPLLAGFSQPLAGEFAGRRPLFEAIPFPVGYGVEIAVLIDALRIAGLDALAECHLGTRQNRHQPLRA